MSVIIMMGWVLCAYFLLALNAYLGQTRVDCLLNTSN